MERVTPRDIKRIAVIFTITLAVNSAALFVLYYLGFALIFSIDIWTWLPVFVLFVPLVVLQPWYTIGIISGWGNVPYLLSVAIVNIFVTTLVYCWLDRRGRLKFGMASREEKPFAARVCDHGVIDDTVLLSPLHRFSATLP